MDTKNSIVKKQKLNCDDKLRRQNPDHKARMREYPSKINVSDVYI